MSKSNIGKLAAIYGMFALMSQEYAGKDGTMSNRGEVSGKKYKQCPKGCKEFFFNENGYLCGRDNYTWSCYALSEDRAIKKYKNQLSKDNEK
jgi:hypothetical protein